MLALLTTYPETAVTDSTRDLVEEWELWPVLL